MNRKNIGTLVDVFIYLLGIRGKRESNGKVASFQTLHAFLLDKNTMVVSVEGESCARIDLSELDTVTYERLCIHLISCGFVTPFVELISSAIFSAISWLQPPDEPPKISPSTELTIEMDIVPQTETT